MTAATITEHPAGTGPDTPAKDPAKPATTLYLLEERTSIVEDVTAADAASGDLVEIDVWLPVGTYEAPSRRRRSKVLVEAVAAHPAFAERCMKLGGERARIVVASAVYEDTVAPRIGLGAS